MSTEYSRYYSANADYLAGDPIDDRDIDGEFDAITVALNRKAIIKATAPSSPIAGMLWLDSTNKVLKQYRNSEWVIMGIVHVGTAAPSTVQEGDLWYDTTNNVLKSYDGSSWTQAGAGSKHIIARGFELTYYTAGAVYVEPGTLFHGATEIDKTARTTLTLATGADWIDGSAPASLLNIWVYVYVDASGNIKLHEVAPDKADTSGNTVGKLIYYYYAAGASYWRWIGQVRTDGSGNIIKTYQVGDWIWYDAEQQLLSGGTATTWTTVDLSSRVPATSKQVYRVASGSYNNSSNFSYYDRANGSAITIAKITYPGGGSAGGLSWGAEGQLDTSAAQVIQYQVSGTAPSVSIYVMGYYCSRN